VRAGAVVPLVGLMTDNSKEAQLYAIVALRTLACETENIPAIAKEGGIEPMVDLLDTGTAEIRAHAAAGLRIVARGSQQGRLDIVRAGGIQVLVHALRSNGSSEVQANAAAALANLVADVPENAQAAAGLAREASEAGAIGPLICLLASENLWSQSYAAAAIANLARGNRNNSVAIVEAGGLISLVVLLSKGIDQAQFYAACALWNLKSAIGNETSLPQLHSEVPWTLVSTLLQSRPVDLR